jgi:hypothetical protein
MAEKVEKTTVQEVVGAMGEETNALVAAKYGITRAYLFKRLKRELNATDTITVYEKDKEGTEAVAKKKRMPLWGTQQKARMDAHKLLNHYPSESHDLNVGGTIPVEVFTGRPPAEGADE